MLSRGKYSALWLLAFLLLAAIATRFYLAVDNARVAHQIMSAQATVATAQRTEPMVRQMASRLAHYSAQEPELMDLLRQHNLRVSPLEQPGVRP